MFEYVRRRLQAIEATADGKIFPDLLPDLRQLGLDDFGTLMFEMPDPGFPSLSSVLPRMASADVQDSWTGNHGSILLRQTCNFVRSAAYNDARLTGRPLDQARILDFGCGYGRIARLMYCFTNPERLFGVEPWRRSIELCHEAGLTEGFRRSDDLPRDLPVGDVSFDFADAFSVFTHLSENATRLALAALRRHIAPGGVLLITIRPVEYWDLPAAIHGHEDTGPFKESHRRDGFAFSPHDRELVAGEVTYGDTSLSLDWLEREVPGWAIAGIDRTLDDAYQLYVFLRPS